MLKEGFISIRMPKELLEKSRLVAGEKFMNLSEYIRLLLIMELDKSKVVDAHRKLK